jgi:hypothetical protein
MEKITFTREELYDKVWSIPLTTLAKTYAISDVGLRKICIKMQIPLPKGGHWEKVRYNHPHEKKELPSDYLGVTEVTLKLREKRDESEPPFIAPLILLEQQISKEYEKNLIVPIRLNKPDKLTIETRKDLKDGSTNLWSGRLVRGYGKGFDVQVSRKKIGRALRIIDTFIKVATLRGHSFYKDRFDTIIRIYGESIQINLKETTEKVLKPTKKNDKHYEDMPNGIFTFNARIGKNMKTWTDGKVMLENQLANIIARLEIQGEKLQEIRKEAHEKHLIHLEEERLRKLLLEQKENELTKFNQLVKNAKHWQEAINIRNYLNSFKEKLESHSMLTEENEKFLSWGYKKADWLDPMNEEIDELLTEKYKERIEFNFDKIEPKNIFQRF